MKRDLLSFLFLESAEADADESKRAEIAENLEQLFEAADECVCKDLEAKKTPLTKALSEFGISEADLQLDPEGFCIETDNGDRYRDILTVLSTAENTHKLAEMGWVVTKPGDDAMTNEAPHYRIRFLDITTVDTGDADKPDEKIKAITKKAREFATTPEERGDDDLNPVDNEDGKMGKKATGVGKAKDGEDPDKAIHDAIQSGDVDKLLEMTTTGSMGTLEQGALGAGIIKKPKPYGKGTKFAMPGQWKVKQPVVNKQIKRHPTSEGIEGQGPGGTPPPLHALHPDRLMAMPKNAPPVSDPAIPCRGCGELITPKLALPHPLSGAKGRPERMEFACPYCGEYWEEAPGDIGESTVQSFLQEPLPEKRAQEPELPPTEE